MDEKGVSRSGTPLRVSGARQQEGGGANRPIPGKRPDRLIEQPRLGERVDEFAPREVQRLLVGHYEMRCDTHETTIYILRIWHTREDQ